jgi:hypothetical protein
MNAKKSFKIVCFYYLQAELNAFSAYDKLKRKQDNNVNK